MNKTVQVISVEATCSVNIRVNDTAPDDTFSRMMLPQNYDMFYGKMNEDEVCAHFAYNALSNGCTDVSELDGWADLPRHAVWLTVVDVDGIEVIGKEPTE